MTHPQVLTALIARYNEWILELSRDPNVADQAPGAA